MTKETYWAIDADFHSDCRKEKPKRKRKLDTNEELKNQVFSLLAFEWSPEQIAKRLKRQYPHDIRMHISHESIYTYIYCLPRGELKKRAHWVPAQRAKGAQAQGWGV
jgi:IS30 family transposase